MCVCYVRWVIRCLTPEFFRLLEDVAKGCDMVFTGAPCIAGSNSTIYLTSDLGLLSLLLHIMLMFVLVARTRCVHVWVGVVRWRPL